MRRTRFKEYRHPKSRAYVVEDTNESITYEFSYREIEIGLPVTFKYGITTTIWGSKGRLSWCMTVFKHKMQVSACEVVKHVRDVNLKDPFKE